MEVPRQETEDGRKEIYGGGRNKRRGQENPRMKSSEEPKLRMHKQPLGEITYSLAHQYVGFLYMHFSPKLHGELRISTGFLRKEEK